MLTRSPPSSGDGSKLILMTRCLQRLVDKVEPACDGLMPTKLEHFISRHMYLLVLFSLFSIDASFFSALSIATNCPFRVVASTVVQLVILLAGKIASRAMLVTVLLVG